MNSAATALHFAGVARLRADPTGALATAGIVTTSGENGMTAGRRISTKFGQHAPLPYVEVNLNTETAALFTTTTTGTDNVFGGTCWSTSFDRVLALAAACVEALTDGLLTADDFQFMPFRDTFVGSPYEEGADGTAGAWGCPFRVRYRVHRTVSA